MVIYNNILRKFPRTGLSYAFGYGSGVKLQSGYNSRNLQKDNVIDLVFCVNDSLKWHSKNMLLNPSHYSALRFLGPNFITNYQERFGARVYCNTLVPLPDLGVNIKYSVVSRKHLLEDLQKWRYLYLGGRLHKPIHNIVEPLDEDDDLHRSLETNLVNAFRVALLQLPERFTSKELFYTIAGLSYNGDYRMIFGENKNKVQNIVKAQESEIFKLYQPAMKVLSDYVAVDYNAKELGHDGKTTHFEQDKSTLAIVQHIRNTPAELQRRLKNNTAFGGEFIDVAHHLSRSGNLVKIVQISLKDIVWHSSITQSLKNIPTAGFTKSIVYSYRKALKTFAKA